MFYFTLCEVYEIVIAQFVSTFLLTHTVHINVY